jgi:hypothetical protein
MSPGSNSRSVSRREWLRVGALSTVGLTLPQLLAGRTAAGATGESARGGYFGRAKSCILCFMWGGQPHQDLYDLKPQAPVELRGECHPVSSSVPGTQLGNLIPRIAARAHRYALVRSVTHPDSTHTIAMHYMMTGHRHRRPESNPMNAPDDFPCFGAVMQKLRPGIGSLPAGISLNAPGLEIPLGHVFPGYFAGFLGSGYDPMFVTADPALPDFAPIQRIDPSARPDLQRRVALLEELDAFRHRHSFDPIVRQAASFQEKALHLIRSDEASRAFDLRREPAGVREKFGFSPFGQGCLLARRLVESGVKLVTVNWTRTYQPGVADLWDTHARHFPLLRERLCPPFDLGFSTLLDDLEERGLLDETLVVVMGEFGRTPQINPNGGRDHWPGCNSVLLAGAGIRGGAVLGSSDHLAMYPASDPVGPEDLAATIYHALGLPLQTHLVDRSGRPHALSSGRPLFELFG